MRRALKLARAYVGRTAPNPAVGAVVVDAHGNKLGAGAHQAAGTPHAEVHALAAAGAAARGATLYVTLEPCSHYGRTPPCAEAVIAAGIARVVVGCPDPSTKVAGRGIAKLRAAGIAVEVGIEAEACADLIADFAVWSAASRPYVIHKVALTLDGASASAAGRREAITGAAVQRRVHALRATCDAVLVGAGTWRADTPDLMPRLAPTRGPAPWRCVAATHLPAAPGAGDHRDHSRTWWLVANADAAARAAWEQVGARIDVLPNTQPQTLLATLWQGGVHRLLLEGGALLARSFWDADLIDRWVFAYGAKLAGGRADVSAYSGDPTRPLANARALHVCRIARAGTDLWVEAVRRNDSGSSRRA